MPSPWPQTPPTAAHRAAYADAVQRSYWLDSLPERTPHPPLEAVIDADLCIVGGGYTGLWAALHAKQFDPGRDVVLLEATRFGGGASGRNGGFVESSLGALWTRTGSSPSRSIQTGAPRSGGGAGRASATWATSSTTRG